MSDKRGLLVIHADTPLSFESRLRIREVLDPIAEKLGMVGLVTEQGLEAQMHWDLSPLVDAINAQSEAIMALVHQNAALIQALSGEQEEEPGPATYMDGTPVLS